MKKSFHKNTDKKKTLVRKMQRKIKLVRVESELNKKNWD
jgi:hypothetical protein